MRSSLAESAAVPSTYRELRTLTAAELVEVKRRVQDRQTLGVLPASLGAGLGIGVLPFFSFSPAAWATAAVCAALGLSSYHLIAARALRQELALLQVSRDRHSVVKRAFARSARHHRGLRQRVSEEEYLAQWAATVVELLRAERQ